MQKRGQINGGLVTGLIFGIAGLIITSIIAFVIVGTLTDTNLLENGRTTSTVTNETGAHLNTTLNPYTLAQVDTVTRFGYAITSIYGNSSTTYDTLIPAANYTVSSVGVLTTTDGTYPNWSDVSVSYTFQTYTNEELAEGRLTSNFTSGIDNVSGKIPTVLLVAAVVLIIGVLALLVGTWQKMKAGGANL